MNILRRFKPENPALPIVVEFANERENFHGPQLTSAEFKFIADYCDEPAMLSKDQPFRNVLEMDKR